jgi:hypothetical protein
VSARTTVSFDEACRRLKMTGEEVTRAVGGGELTPTTSKHVVGLAFRESELVRFQVDKLMKARRVAEGGE